MSLWWQRSLACSINKGVGLGAWLTDVIHTTTWNPSHRWLPVDLRSPSCAHGASTPTRDVLSLYVWTPCRRCYGCYCVDWLQRRRGCCRDDHEEEAIIIDYFIYTDVRLCWIDALTLLSLLSASSDNDDLWPPLLTSFLCVTVDVVLV
jgi:hypothetical protein